MGFMIVTLIIVVFFTVIIMNGAKALDFEEREEIKPVADFSEEQNSIYLTAANELVGNEIDVKPADIEARIRSGKPFEPVAEAAEEICDYDAVFNWDVLCEAEDCGIGAMALANAVYPDGDNEISGELERAESLLNSVDEKHHYLIHIYRGLLLCSKKNYSEGRAALEKSVELKRSDLTLYSLAFTYIDEVDPKVTITQFRKALQIVKGWSMVEYLICYYVFDSYCWEKYIPKQNPPADMKESARLVLDTLGKISFEEKSDPEKMRLEILASWSNLLGAYNTIENYEKLFESGYSDSSLYYECYLYCKGKGKEAEAKVFRRKAKGLVKESFLKERYGA